MNDSNPRQQTSSCLTSCWPTCGRIALPNNPSTSSTSEPWYAQSHATPSTGTSRTPGEWDDATRRREADLLSLHEGITFSSTRHVQGGRRGRRRYTGGDISGGGAEEGSGLSRWKLFKSWLGGERRGIRLPDDDQEEEEGNLSDESVDGEREIIDLSDHDPGVVREGESDALPLSPEAILSPPHVSPTHSIIMSSREMDREERRAKRRIKRRAKELGLSLEQFEQGFDAAELNSSREDTMEEASTQSQPRHHQPASSRSDYSGESNSTSSRTHSHHSNPRHYSAAPHLDSYSLPTARPASSTTSSESRTHRSHHRNVSDYESSTTHYSKQRSISSASSSERRHRSSKSHVDPSHTEKTESSGRRNRKGSRIEEVEEDLFLNGTYSMGDGGRYGVDDAGQARFVPSYVVDEHGESYYTAEGMEEEEEEEEDRYAHIGSIDPISTALHAAPATVDTLPTSTILETIDEVDNGSKLSSITTPNAFLLALKSTKRHITPVDVTTVALEHNVAEVEEESTASLLGSILSGGELSSSGQQDDGNAWRHNSEDDDSD